MLSLARIVLDQTVHLTEQGDKTPTARRLLNIEIANQVSAIVPLFDQIQYALTSQSHAHILWALSAIVKNARADGRLLQLVPTALRLLDSDSIEIEFAAAHSLVLLSHALPASLAPIVMQPVLERLRRSPAVELIQCLRPLIPVLAPDIVRQRIADAIGELLKMSDAHQFAAGELLLLAPQLLIDSTTDVLTMILSGPIVVTHYLADAIRAISHTVNLNWFENTLPKQMLLQANSFAQMRYGCCRALVSVLEFADSPQIHLFIRTAFGWASTAENIAFLVVEHTDVLAAYHNGEFQAKVRDIALRISKSAAVPIRVRLCEIYAANPLFYLSSDALFGRVYKSLAEDSEIEVRLSYIKHFPLLYTRCSSVQLTDLLFSLLLFSFSSSDRRIHHALLSHSALFRALNASKINALMPGFLRICEGLIRWRLIASAVAIFIDFPTDCIASSWRPMGAILRVKHAQFPFALADATAAFYARVLIATQEAEILGAALSLARAPTHQLRSFFIQLAAMLGHLRPSGFVDRLWPAALALAQDPVLAVRCTFLRCAAQFHDAFVETGDRAAVKNLTTVFMILGTVADPALEAVWRDAAAQLAGERDHSQGHFSQLYRSATAFDAPVVKARPPLRRPEPLRPVPTTDPSRKRNYVEPARRSLGGRPRP
jgi:hypothetical protein